MLRLHPREYPLTPASKAASIGLTGPANSIPAACADHTNATRSYIDKAHTCAHHQLSRIKAKPNQPFLYSAQSSKKSVQPLMADSSSKNSGAAPPRRRPSSSSRLQNRAPASIQVTPPSNYASGWKIAIPLLSPVMEPEEDPFINASSGQESSSHQDRQSSSSSAAGIPSFRSWQHPAAPFVHKMGSTPAFVFPQSQCT